MGDAPFGWLHVVIDVPHDWAPAARRFWTGVTGWQPSAPWEGHPEFTSLEPPDGDAYVHVQQIGAAPRVHIDLSVVDVDHETERLVGLGATLGERRHAWQVMASPGGLPFCLVSAGPPPDRPGPVTWPDGHRSRVAQVCIDVPERVYGTEWPFWQHATGWASTGSSYDEFESLLPPADCPVRLLVQRLDSAEPDAHVGAHIDLGTDDVEAEVDRVLGIGASLVDDTHPWVVLRDEAGLEFCVTPRSPD